MTFDICAIKKSEIRCRADATAQVDSLHQFGLPSAQVTPAPLLRERHGKAGPRCLAISIMPSSCGLEPAGLGATSSTRATKPPAADRR